MKNWVAKRQDKGFEVYWREKNRLSVDGLPTHVLDDE